MYLLYSSEIFICWERHYRGSEPDMRRIELCTSIRFGVNGMGAIGIDGLIKYVSRMTRAIGSNSEVLEGKTIPVYKLLPGSEYDNKAVSEKDAKRYLSKDSGLVDLGNYIKSLEETHGVSIQYHPGLEKDVAGMDGGGNTVYLNGLNELEDIKNGNGMRYVPMKKFLEFLALHEKGHKVKKTTDDVAAQDHVKEYALSIGDKNLYDLAVINDKLITGADPNRN